MSAVLPHDAAAQPQEAPAAPVESDKALEARLPTPAERLQQSRDRMARWMIQADGRSIARRRAEGESDGWSWLGSLRSNPVVALVTDAISAWWANHPLHPAAGLAEGVARDAVAPLARRHPRAVVAGAFLVGALVVWARPWRWLAKPALFTGILSQMASHVIAHVPFESILDTLNDFMGRRAQPSDVDETAQPMSGVDVGVGEPAAPASAASAVKEAADV